MRWLGNAYLVVFTWFYPSPIDGGEVLDQADLICACMLPCAQVFVHAHARTWGMVGQLGQGIMHFVLM